MNSNLLAREQSPYLLQHKDNPVAWMPWGAEAFSRAVREDKPILLSIGYAACHWCHVMAHESFEDSAVAELMNRDFINIKVDREERPEVDKLYMEALHRLGEQGGWPLTMFLRPDGAPFWGGTYFPPEPRFGRPSFRQVLTEISRIWRHERSKADLNSTAILKSLQIQPPLRSEAMITPEALDATARTLVAATDMQHGGLRGAPKFPQTSVYDFLWRHFLRTGDRASRDAVIVTLNNLCQGGIYDHLAGGFARYSVDHRWLVPHFEKMLYDNALIVSLLSRVAAHEENGLFRNRIEETVTWLVTEMRTQARTFAASYDADSEGEEGRYYVWDHEDVLEILPKASADLFCRVYDVTRQGNWEGKNILNRLNAQATLSPEIEDTLASCRRLLLEKRRERIPPGFDDKSLADWNGLAIAAIAEAAMLTQNPAWLGSAEEAFASLLNQHWSSGSLFHSYRNGELRNLATSDGYANLAAAALNLYTATGKDSYLTKARDLVSSAIAQLWDDSRGGFFFAPRQTPELIVRSLHAHDDATPNANATMLVNFTRLYHLTGNDDDRKYAETLIRNFGKDAAGNPFAFASFLSAVTFHLEPLQAVIIGDANGPQELELRRAVLQLPVLQPILQYVPAGTDLPPNHPAHGKTQKESSATLYLCLGTRCALPVIDPSHTRTAFQSIRSSGIH
jgi:hypothetical protein